MNARTKISEKGQVVVPKATRDRLGWQPGLDVDVVEGPDSVTFRRRDARKTLTVDEAVVRLRQIYTHKGPPVPIEEMSMFAEMTAAEHRARSR